MESTDAKTNHDLTEDYRGLTLKYKDLQAKFRHFEIAGMFILWIVLVVGVLEMLFNNNNIKKKKINNDNIA